MAIKVSPRRLRRLEDSLEAEFDIEVPKDKDKGADGLINDYIKDLAGNVGPFDRVYLHGIERRLVIFPKESELARVNNKVAVFRAYGNLGVEGKEFSLRLRLDQVSVGENTVLYKGNFAANGDTNKALSTYERIWGEGRIKL